MSVVEVDKNGQVMVITLNRPDRLNALGFQLRSEMAEDRNKKTYFLNGYPKNSTCRELVLVTHTS